MTLDEARHVADLLHTLDDAETFGETFRDEPARFILFEDIVCAGNIRGDGPRGGWEGAIRMSRATAVEMMAWLKARTEAELAELLVAPVTATLKAVRDNPAALMGDDGK